MSLSQHCCDSCPFSIFTPHSGPIKSLGRRYKLCSTIHDINCHIFHFSFNFFFIQKIILIILFPCSCNFDLLFVSRASYSPCLRRLMVLKLLQQHQTSFTDFLGTSILTDLFFVSYRTLPSLVITIILAKKFHSILFSEIS